MIFSSFLIIELSKWMIRSIFKQKFQTLNGCSITNVSICCFSSIRISVNCLSLVFDEFAGQNFLKMSHWSRCFQMCHWPNIESIIAASYSPNNSDIEYKYDDSETKCPLLLWLRSSEEAPFTSLWDSLCPKCSSYTTSWPPHCSS